MTDEGETKSEHVVGDWRVADGLFPETLIWENFSSCGAEVRNIGFARDANEARKIVAFHNSSRFALTDAAGDLASPPAGTAT